MYKSSGVRSLCEACLPFWLLHICGELNSKLKSQQGLNTGKCWVKQWRGSWWSWEHGSRSPGPYLCKGQKGACAEESGHRELPSTVKAEIKTSIHFLFRGRTLARQRLMTGNLVCQWRKQYCSLSTTHVLLPLSQLSASFASRLRWHQTLSGIRQHRVSDHSSDPLSSAFFHAWMEPCDSLTASHKEAESPDGLVEHQPCCTFLRLRLQPLLPRIPLPLGL